MNPHLVLWRHAEAEAGADDLSRTLTARGAKQARKVAAWLAPRLPEGYRILTSPAVRAIETARALGGSARVVGALGPGASGEDVLATAGWPPGRGAVVVVGHQPSLGRAASLLLSGRELDWVIRKGAIYWIERRARGGDPELLLRAVVEPRAL